MLNARLAANSQASRDFDEWCLRQLPELPLPARVLDLGAGTGKQVQLFAPLFTPRSEFWALDSSGESLAQLQQSYQAPPALHIKEGSFDELEQYPELIADTFDLIYASYALYYTHALPHVIREVHRLLKPGGVFWVIAPYMGTNDEFLRIIRPLHEVDAFMDYVFDQFHAEVVQESEKAGFRSLKPSLFRNKIRFDTPEAFMKYLSHSLFYRAGHDEAILEAVGKEIAEKGAFTVSKNVISLQLRK
ncbi:MAG: class I SAM-dependent methyltransferase [Bacteroidetes bacterium]|nr:MAG: class I SAM-dependent methyltransferase [Bacteroidota bacterium]